MRHPLIIIPAGEDIDGKQRAFFAIRTYINAIERAGGVPLLIARPKKNTLNEIVALADGILLTGGRDVHPKHYGESNRACNGVDRERDRLEIALVRLAVKKKIPIFCICRGMQVLNVALGGSLYQDVLAELPNAIRHDFHKDETTGEKLPRALLAHEVTIESGTLLAKLTKKDRLAVNSLHHQGVKKLGRSLVASALAPDGLVEAIEFPRHPFALGIEWHPEDLNDHPSRNIFSAFIGAARKSAT